MLGINRPLEGTQVAALPIYYCVNPAVAIVSFVFRFMSVLIVAGAGVYLMLNGKPR